MWNRVSVQILLVTSVMCLGCSHAKQKSDECRLVSETTEVIFFEMQRTYYSLEKSLLITPKKKEVILNKTKDILSDFNLYRNNCDVCLSKDRDVEKCLALEFKSYLGKIDELYENDNLSKDLAELDFNVELNLLVEYYKLRGALLGHRFINDI